MGAGRTAIIAIHGVGEHASGQTAKAVAQQLQYHAPVEFPSPALSYISLPVAGRDLFTSDGFADETIGTSTSPANEKSPTGSLAKQPSRFREGMESEFAPRAKGGDRDVDIDFSSSLLKDGTDYTSTYETVRYRMVPEGKTEAPLKLDIFELYWSDLSHVGKNSLSILKELFQIVIHLASLGRTAAVTTFRIAKGSDAEKAWPCFYWLTSLSYWLLATPIVVGNFILALTGLLVLPTLLLSPKAGLGFLRNEYVQTLTCPLIIFIAVAIISIRYVVGSEQVISRFLTKIIMISLPFLLGLLSGYVFYGIQAWLLRMGIDFLYIVTGIELCLLALAGTAIMRLYDRIRPGAFVLWCVAGAVLLAWMAWVAYRQPLFRSNPPYDLLNWIGHSGEGPFVVLILVWSLLYAVNLGMVVTGSLIEWRLTRNADPGQREIIKRTIHTAYIAGSLPAPIFLAVVLTVWAVISFTFSGMLSCDKVPSCEDYVPWATYFIGKDSLHIQDFVNKLVDLSANELFIFYTSTMILAALVAFWGLAPSIYRELFPGDLSKPEPPEWPAERLSLWLDGGYLLLGLAAIIATIGFFVIFPMGSLQAFWHIAGPLLPPGAANSPWRSFTSLVGLFIGGATVGFIAASQLLLKSFTETINRFRVLVDVAIDVDNWLRERPVGRTPRLRIFARLAALLKFLRDEEYDRIVIVSHSQGTTIATDFLRYMKSMKILQEGITIDLFTLGSPLRQLYARRFPALYQWADPALGSNKTDHGPSPAECGVRRWHNIYGSGDYVGRALWDKSDSKRKDFCLGAEAHTHYFDQNCWLVATRLREFLRNDRAAD